MKTKQGADGQRWERVSQAVDEHQAKLIRYAASIVKDRERAKDVVQETFIRLCRQDWQEVEGHLQAWLFRVTRNLALDVTRKEKRMSYVEEPDSMERLAGDRDGAAREQDRRERAGSLLELADALPSKQREVVLLKFQQDLTYKEISEITGLSVSNVGYLLHHALKDLKSRWQASQPL
ncbi:sigma-70 family RNA polymerase sigma factor [Pelagicoccus sp. SDUM812003]|uniref:RNA polymerase sigma factor n=1 Tax=Pelagicoccus sp. SDUM812003 TaxID=3041267 RepID=UPI00280F873C|nr:sigma-70 family RNA polymerase sigma factor [Pelagicoccus sp. SDUM812003]MDQ8205305.1 sigma-70 family RNA polymerase sigma factor [Pelagicoccus sp. SDUM812003]